MFPDLKRPLYNLARYLSPALSMLTSNRMSAGTTQALAGYVELLLGKGTGTTPALETKTAAQFIKRSSPVIFDVGANTGEWTMEMHKYHPDAHWVLFEPAAACLEILSSLPLENVVLHGKALGMKTGSAFLHSSGSFDTTASLHQRHEPAFSSLEYQPHKVDITTLDSAMMEVDQPYVDFMKLDVEGHELFVLQGGRTALAEGKIRALSFEFGSGNINSRTYFRDFWMLLTGYHYRIARLLPSGKLLPVASYEETLEYFRHVTTYFAWIDDK